TRASAPPPALQGPMPAASAQPVHILDRLNAVFKHRRLAGASFALVVTVMMIQAYSTIPTYQASARVQILDERSTQVTPISSNDPTYWQDPDQYYKTQYSILNSRALAKRVVERLKLVNDAAFNGSGPRPRDPLSLLRQGRAAASHWFRSLVTKPPVPGVPRPSGLQEDERESAVISGFLGGLQIIPEVGTRLVTIQYRYSDPVFAATAANAVADEYTSQNLDLRLQNVDNALTYLDDELGRQKGQMEKGEAALAQYREQNDALSLEDHENTVAQRVNTTADQLTQAHYQRLAKESIYNQIKSADPKADSSDQYSVIGNDPAVVEAKNKLLKAQSDLKTLTDQKFGPEWPAVKSAQSDLDAARRELIAARAQVVDRIRNEYTQLVTAETSYGVANDQAKQASMTLDRKSADYKVLENQASTQQTAYQSLLQRQKDLSLIKNSHANNVQVYERAEVQKFPIAPNPRREWIMALLAGVTVAFLLAFGIEYLDDTVKVPEDITRRLRLPLLGLVPAIRGDRVPVLAETVPHEFGEAFRSLRTSLVFTAGGDHGRIIAVTSSQPLEGKTTTAANLAFALALGGSRVLLIDADMRRPGLHKTIGMDN
ncbi:MAG TPA: GNVR domain-containing protein, partial [Vicinamibacterales bacterium]